MQSKQKNLDLQIINKHTLYKLTYSYIRYPKIFQKASRNCFDRSVNKFLMNFKYIRAKSYFKSLWACLSLLSDRYRQFKCIIKYSSFQYFGGNSVLKGFLHFKMQMLTRIYTRSILLNGLTLLNSELFSCLVNKIT